MTTTTHPVDSATRPCCGGIGTHTRSCLPAGAIKVDDWSGDSRIFFGANRPVAVTDWDRIEVGVGGEQYATGRITRFVHIIVNGVPAGNGPLSTDEARQLAARLLAAADELDALNAEDR